MTLILLGSFAIGWFALLLLWGRECLASQEERRLKNQNADDLDDALDQLATVKDAAETYAALNTHHRETLIVTIRALQLALNGDTDHAIAMMQEHSPC